MSDMDLIPGDFRKDLKLQRLVRLFLLTCVVVLGLTGLARGLLAYLTWRENVQLVRLEQQEQVLVNNKSRSDTLQQQKQVTQQQLTALNALRGGDSVPVFLQAVDQAYVQGIWFDSVHFMRSQGTGTLDNVPAAARAGIIVVPSGAGATQSLGINQGVDIVGHALTHSLLAEFMRKLGGQPGVADLRLIDTGTRNYTAVQVVDFKLTLQMKNVRASP